MFKKIPHTFTIVFFLILMAAVLTWIVPGGSFSREVIDVNGSQREVVVNNSFHYVDSNPQTWQIFSSFFNGFVDKADIIVFILMVGGAFWILNSSKSIDVGVGAFLRKVKKLQKYKLLKSLGVLSDKEGLLSWKLDGLTVVLTYESGELKKAVTRGNGEVGEVVTNNARVFKNLPHRIPYQGKLILRGEAVIKYSDFEKIK